MTVSDPTRSAPTRRARNALGVLEQLDGALLRVHPARCVEVRNRNAGCHACADACAGGAICVVDGLLSVDASRCIGCGTCATVCPTCALEALQPSDDELLETAAAALRANGGTTCVVACSDALDAAAPAYDPARVAEVRCLGRVDESLLAALAEQGAERVLLVGRACAGCAHAAGRRAAEQVCATASALLEAWGAPIEITLCDSLPAEVLGACESDPLASQRPPRRAAGAGAPEPAPAGRGYGPGRSSAAAAGGEDCPSTGAVPPASPESAPAPGAPRPEKVGKDGTLAHHVPNRRGRLLASLAALGEPAGQTVTTRLWASVSIDADACTSCRMCTVFCPTGALRRFDERPAGPLGLEHEPARCVACGCCRDICPRGAVTLAEEVFAPDVADGHVERFETRPPQIETGKPTTVVNKMRKILGANQVNFA